MKSLIVKSCFCVALATFCIATAIAVEPTKETKIVLIAGETAKVDVMGHHDYLAGCQCMAELLQQTSGVKAVQITDGWPNDETVLEQANAVVFYTDGGGKQAFLSTADRVAKLDQLIQRGAGVVMIHQAVDFPDEFASEGKRWLGGVFLLRKSDRGHWDSKHVDFPIHPTTQGVSPWEINDGWLNGINFVQDLKGITPLVWSGKEYLESRAGLEKDIVGWAYDRPDGGRSFSFTGLDAHSAWSRPGMRRLIINGILWSAHLEIPKDGAPNEIDQTKLNEMQTPRQPKK